jgi:glutathione S-transferase
VIVYGSSLSPFVRKVVVFCAEKGLEPEVRSTGLGGGGADFAEASPFRKMPGFRDPGAAEDGGDFCISDSTAIVHYLEAKHPEPNLLPRAPAALARTVWYEEFTDTIVMKAGGALFFNRIVAPLFLKRDGDPAAADAAERDELPPIMDYLERVVPYAGGFLVDGRITLADVSVASPFVNFGHLGLDLSRWPRTVAYIAAIHARPSFAGLIAAEQAMLARARAPVPA